MSIILLILKIIGILLLVILALLLLVSSVVLLAPVRYRVKGRAEDKDVTVRIRVRWLFGIITFHGSFVNQDFTQRTKIFGFSLKRNSRGNKRSATMNKKDIIKNPTMREKTKDILDKADVVQKNATLKEIPQKIEKHTEKKEVKRNLSGTIKDLCGMIKSKWENLIEKIKNFKETAGRIKQELQDEMNWEAVKVLFLELKYLLKHISPRKVKASISFGTTDPATTGQVLGVISMIPFLHRYQLGLYPDFEAEQFYLRGSFDLKGHARGIHILLTGYHLLKDKNMRTLIKRFRIS